MVDRMKKRLSMAKAPLPKFRSDMEVAEYLSTQPANLRNAPIFWPDDIMSMGARSL